MKTNWELLLAVVLQLGGWFLMRSAADFLQGMGLAFALCACVLWLRHIVSYLVKTIAARRTADSTQAR